MENADPWLRLFWLLRMTADVAPAYLALFAFPVAALRFAGGVGAARALLALLLGNVGPLLMLAMGAWMFGQASSHGYLHVLQATLGAAGVILVVMITRPLRPHMPAWAFLLFFFGLAVINLMALFVGGMALANDWV